MLHWLCDPPRRSVGLFVGAQLAVGGELRRGSAATPPPPPPPRPPQANGDNNREPPPPLLTWSQSLVCCHCCLSAAVCLDVSTAAFRQRRPASARHNPPAFVPVRIEVKNQGNKQRANSRSRQQPIVVWWPWPRERERERARARARGVLLESQYFQSAASNSNKWHAVTATRDQRQWLAPSRPECREPLTMKARLGSLLAPLAPGPVDTCCGSSSLLSSSSSSSSSSLSPSPSPRTRPPFDKWHAPTGASWRRRANIDLICLPSARPPLEPKQTGADCSKRTLSPTDRRRLPGQRCERLNQ